MKSEQGKYRMWEPTKRQLLQYIEAHIALIYHEYIFDTRTRTRTSTHVAFTLL